ncbi:hypothetical protein [Zunongwangia sp.]|uniref:hypothetical protein n=1 Tax=Zunongwangia sp. TaxID=1965325 RepID=UPI003AA8C65F
MVEIRVLFFLLASFFGIENGQILSEKATVTINPDSKEIEIVQEDLFSIYQSDENSEVVLSEWNKLQFSEKTNTGLRKEMNAFTIESFNLETKKGNIQPHLKLKYSNQDDLKILGIWYNSPKNQFSINNISKDNISSKTGKLVGNYWIFNADKSFSFTLQPFLQLPEAYQEFKQPIEQLLEQH